MTEGRDERATGTPNIIYDLSSVLFHSLQESASINQYIQDAEQDDDQELVEFFRRIRDEDSVRADEAQRLLAERTPAAAGQPEEMISYVPPIITAETPTGIEIPPGTPLQAPPRDLQRGLRQRKQEEKGLIDKAVDKLLGQEEPGREEPETRAAPRGPREDEPLTRP